MTKKSHNIQIGIDIGGTKIEIMAINQTAIILYNERISTPKNDYKGVLNAIKSLLGRLHIAINIDPHIPLGICAPGSISLQTGLMRNSNSACLNEQMFAQDLETLCNRDVRVANDADCFALSESFDGAAKSYNNVFGVILGTGVGGGIVINNKLLQGANGIVGEWGHTPLTLSCYQTETDTAPLDTTSRSCYCGRNDCMETWLAGPSFEKTHAMQFHQSLNAASIDKLAGTGDIDANSSLEQYCNLLALGLANIINTIDPEAIVFGGGISNIDRLYERLPYYLQRYIFSDYLKTKLLKAQYGDASGIKGAARLWST